jgi:hypothetical protein
VEIAGFPIIGWIALFAALGFAGWITSFPVIWLLTARSDGRERDRTSAGFRYQWVVALVLAVIYFIILGNAVGWQVGDPA